MNYFTDFAFQRRLACALLILVPATFSLRAQQGN